MDERWNTFIKIIDPHHPFYLTHKPFLKDMMQKYLKRKEQGKSIYGEAELIHTTLHLYEKWKTNNNFK
jgi:hypothetical protein